MLDGEVISGFLRLRRGQQISEREADAAISSYRAFPVDRQDVLPLRPRITAAARIKRSGAARCEVEVFDVRT